MPNWENLQTEIENTYLRSKDLTELSKTRYAEAQTLLLAERRYQEAPTPLPQIMPACNEQNALRYFQPKYDDISVPSNVIPAVGIPESGHLQKMC